MQTVIIAGGLGTRMSPWTDNCPKTLLPIAGKPFAHHQLAWLASEGVTEVVYCIGNLGNQVQEGIGNDFAGMSIRYSKELEPLGKLDAIRNALPLLRPWFFSIYGDSYLPHVNLRQMAYRFHFANIQSRLISTWNGVDYGISIMRRSIFEHEEYPVSHRWYEIGSPEGYEELQSILEQA